MNVYRSPRLPPPPPPAPRDLEIGLLLLGSLSPQPHLTFIREVATLPTQACGLGFSRLFFFFFFFSASYAHFLPSLGIIQLVAGDGGGGWGGSSLRRFWRRLQLLVGVRGGRGQLGRGHFTFCMTLSRSGICGASGDEVPWYSTYSTFSLVSFEREGRVLSEAHEDSSRH
jgi:hypothetical protein